MQTCRTMVVILLACFLTSCGFQLRGAIPLAPPLKRMYLQSPDPYGYLVRNLRQYLKMSGVQLVDQPQEAATVLVILQDIETQELLSVSGTQQTRQYNLRVTVTFEITDKFGHVIMPSQSITETRPITVQSNQILGSNNEATLFYQQMRRTLAYAIMTRLSSVSTTETINDAFEPGKQSLAGKTGYR